MKKIYFLWASLLLNSTTNYADDMGHTIYGLHGEAVMQGYIVASPCSIETDSQYQ